jgi:hypothetical protein
MEGVDSNRGNKTQLLPLSDYNVSSHFRGYRAMLSM